MQAVYESLDGMLAAMIASAAPWDPAAVYVSLITGITQHGVATVRTDVTEPNLTDYPRQVLTAWGTPYRLADGSPAVDGPLITFAPPDDVHPVTILGYAYFDAATVGNLLGYTMLSTQVVLTLTTDHWNIVPRLILPAAANYESSHQWNG